MKKIVFAFTSLIVLLVLVACAPSTTPTPAPTREEPTATSPAPTATPTEEPTSTPEPTPAPTATPIPTPTSTPKPTPWEPQRSELFCEPSDTKTCNILYILVDQYDDEHVIRTRPHFEEMGYTAFVASNTLETRRGFHECYGFTPAYPDLLIGDVVVADYDLIVFTGDDGNTVVLHNDSETHRIGREAMEQEKVIAAAGDGPVILAKAGVLEGRTVTVLNNVQWFGIGDQWIDAVEKRGATFIDHSPVRDGLLVTADFATPNFLLGLIEVLEEQSQTG
jgi:putative intracellular protease/amidase